MAENPRPQFSLRFENVYYNLHASHMSALVALVAKAEPRKRSEIEPLFNNHIKQEIFGIGTPRDLLLHLEYLGMLRYSEVGFEVTSIGVEFVRYVKAWHPQDLIPDSG